MKRAIVFEPADDFTVTQQPIEDRCVGRPQRYATSNAVPDFGNMGGLMVGDQLVLYATGMVLHGDFVFLGQDGNQFCFASLEIW